MTLQVKAQHYFYLTFKTFLTVLEIKKTKSKIETLIIRAMYYLFSSVIQYLQEIDIVKMSNTLGLYRLYNQI